MRNIRLYLIVALALLGAQRSLGTNGDKLEGIGAVSGAMGGTGVAAPQDNLSAVVNNPAGLAGLQDGDIDDVVVGLTLFQPEVEAKIATPAGTLQGESDDPLSVIPFLGYGAAINEKLSFGFGAYGVSGMGTDYRGKGWDLDGNPANGFEGDLFVKLSVLKVAPSLAYAVSEALSIGVSLHGNYSTLDMGQGESDDFSAGGQFGALYRAGDLRFGASYTTPQKATFDGVYNFDAFLGDQGKDSLSLEQPELFAGGVAWQAAENLLIEFNVKHLAWGDAAGYGDFDWEDQEVYALGVQYAANDKLTLRAGFNYGENPVKENRGWNPQGVTTVQGKSVPVFGYEMLRTIGFPAIVESHLTLGFGYKLSDSLSLNAAYMHAFEATGSSVSMGDAISLESTLVEDSFTVALAWSFN
jgi:long-chain fatty acid transport protein